MTPLRKLFLEAPLERLEIFQDALPGIKPNFGPIPDTPPPTGEIAYRMEPSGAESSIVSDLREPRD